jgi:hypothetical protein
MSTQPAVVAVAPEKYNRWKDPEYLRAYKRDFMRRSRHTARDRQLVQSATKLPDSAVIFGVRLGREDFERLRKLLRRVQ